MENHYRNIKSLIENTKDKIGKPVSSQVVAATIESLGIREKRHHDGLWFSVHSRIGRISFFMN
jgi:hypothetical protein